MDQENHHDDLLLFDRDPYERFRRSPRIASTPLFRRGVLTNRRRLTVINDQTQ
jgi:hypothetical protein